MVVEDLPGRRKPRRHAGLRNGGDDNGNVKGARGTRLQDLERRIHEQLHVATEEKTQRLEERVARLERTLAPQGRRAAAAGAEKAA